MCSLSASGIADGRDGPSQHEAPSDRLVLGRVPDDHKRVVLLSITHKYFG